MEEKRTKEAPKSFLDYNASWPLTLVYLGYLLGIYFAQQYSTRFLSNNMSGMVYYLVAMICGVIGTFLIYNFGKIIFASIAGYEVVLIKILGVSIDRSKGNTNVSFNIVDVFTLSMRFAPKNDDKEKNPSLIFFGGVILEAVLLVLALIFFFLFSFDKSGATANFGWTFLFAAVYGFLTPLYEMLPFRQDFPTDMYNFIMTRQKDDRIAFNIYLINQKREMTGENFIIPEFENYDSFYKLHTLYYVYLQDLYESKLAKANSVLEDMKYYSKYYLEDERYLPIAETVYLKFLIDDESGANKAFLSIKKDGRKNVTSPMILSVYRIGLLVLSSIHSDKEAVLNLIKEFDKITSSYKEESARVKKEKMFFDSAYEKVCRLKPDWNLPTR